jgi:probable rRNA maturation factor
VQQFAGGPPLSFCSARCLRCCGLQGLSKLVILRRKIVGLSETSLANFLSRARRSVGLKGSVTLVVTSSQEIRSLNARFRGKNRATDVLSFPADSPAQDRGVAGEIAISADIARQNAARFGHSAALEVKVLALHGILHLAGFDHERDNGLMARQEADLRRKLRLPCTLIERSGYGSGDGAATGSSRSFAARRTV